MRTSVSKKLWTKCVDYKIEEKGTYVWYKLVGNSNVPIEVGHKTGRGSFYIKYMKQTC